jgi:hypothetical protein
VLSRAGLGHAQHRVLAAAPMDDQDDLAHLFVDVDHDVVDE